MFRIYLYIFILFFLLSCNPSEFQETDVIKIELKKGVGKRAKTYRIITQKDSILFIINNLNTAERIPHQFSTKDRMVLYYHGNKRKKTVLYSGKWIKYSNRSYKVKQPFTF